MFSPLLRSPALSPKVLCSPIKRNIVDAFSLNSSSYLGKFALNDYEKIFNNLEDIERNFNIRRRVPEIDLYALKELHSILKKHKVYRSSFRKLDRKAGNESLTEEIMFTIQSQNTVTDYKKQYIDDQLNLSFGYYQILRNLFLYFYFKLPNTVHERTPTVDENTIMHLKLSSNCKNNNNDHLAVGKRLGVLHYLNAASYYFLKEAAALDMAVVRFFTDIFQKEMKFTPFSNPDTCGSFVLQGVVGDDLYNEAFLLDDSLFWLPGSASFGTFCGVRVATSTNCKFLPERFFTCGRRYVPPCSLEENGLYTVSQRTNVHFMVATESTDQMMEEFNIILDRIKSFYEQLPLDFRICYLPASQLKLTESCRASIQLYSAQNNSFVEVAHVSIYNDFVSRRLQMMWHNSNREYLFLRVIEGVAISVPAFVACLLELSNDKMLIPKCFHKYMFNIF